jgi:hypothetical protein
MKRQSNERTNSVDANVDVPVDVQENNDFVDRLIDDVDFGPLKDFLEMLKE